jgi:sirohydrochlorin cobaltochelatase
MTAAVNTGRAGLVMLAHGARDARWSAPFEAVAEQVRAQRPGVPVRLAFLEFMQPDLVAAGTALAEAGCTQVVVLPLFLGAGGHVRKDVPALLAQLHQLHPQVQFTLQPAVGEAPELVAAMAAIAAGLLPAGQAA